MELKDRSTKLRVAVIGAGAWGTALALQCHRQGHDVCLWARRSEQAGIMARDLTNASFLPGIPLPPDLMITNDPGLLSGAVLVLWVVPSHGLRAVAAQLSPFLAPGAVMLSASKGIEDETFATMTEVLKEEVKGQAFGVLSGPSFAREVACGLPTAVTLAISEPIMGQLAQEALSSPSFRIYTSDDVLGVELGGTLKNIYAIAAGICDGLNLGYNARASLLTRALSEMGRLARTLGAHPLTLTGLSGLGDLILTATGELSRNRRLGLKLAAGASLSDILGASREVAEGVKNARSILGLARSHKVTLPMAQEVYRVLYENKLPSASMAELINRPLRPELDPEISGWSWR